MNAVLKKQTTSIFRTPPEDANSNLLWNTATQTTSSPNLHHIIFIHHCEKLKQKTQWMVHGGKTELQYHIVFWTHSAWWMWLHCSELWFVLPVKWNKTVKGYNKTKSCKPFWNTKCYEFYIYRWIHSQHNYPKCNSQNKNENIWQLHLPLNMINSNS